MLLLSGSPPRSPASGPPSPPPDPPNNPSKVGAAPTNDKPQTTPVDTRKTLKIFISPNFLVFFEFKSHCGIKSPLLYFTFKF